MRLSAPPTVIPQSTRQSRLQFGDVRPGPEHTEATAGLIEQIMSRQRKEWEKDLQEIRSLSSEAKNLATEAEKDAELVRKIAREKASYNNHLPLMLRFFMPWTWF
jgi:hypothetical protein